MTRRPRSFDPNVTYHFTGHGVDGLGVLDDDLDRHDFLIRLDHIARTERWEVHATCLMGTHHHLVFRPTSGRASEGMRDLHGGFARAFNARRGRRGHVWESRFRIRSIEDEGHHLNAIRYVALNPVRANIVRHPADWPWSTYGQLLGLRPRWAFLDVELVVALFGGERALRDYVEVGDGQPRQSAGVPALPTRV